MDCLNSIQALERYVVLLLATPFGPLRHFVLAHPLAHQAEILPWDLDDEDTTAGIESLWPSIYEQYPDPSGNPDLATQALDYIKHKAVFNERFLEGAKGYHELNPLGSWRRNRDLALPRPVMCHWLIEGGFNPDAVIREWNQKQWLLTEDGKFISRRLVGSIRQSCIAIRGSVMKGDTDED